MRDAISCHGRTTWPWASLLKQHEYETRPCLETVVETARPCPPTVVEPVKIARACAFIHGRGISERRMTRPCNMAVLHDCHVLPDYHDNFFADTVVVEPTSTTIGVSSFNLIIALANYSP
ncbi:hypothetical protein GOBAR_AA04343 [Gossypium barbadense]|uniref:Uncharacterized protein n=1 Tax=Gossypium barbadense TaxID=3634 RepID=A0A2P5YKV9_GOSBA|nr:hypothetical protein GOBAR_AA04343 [Gossypium barbadense]